MRHGYELPIRELPVLRPEDCCSPLVSIVRSVRVGDYADPHASEELPRIMPRGRGRRARRQAPLPDHAANGGNDASGAN